MTISPKSEKKLAAKDQLSNELVRLRYSKQHIDAIIILIDYVTKKTPQANSFQIIASSIEKAKEAIRDITNNPNTSLKKILQSYSTHEIDITQLRAQVDRGGEEGKAEPPVETEIKPSEQATMGKQRFFAHTERGAAELSKLIADLKFKSNLYQVYAISKKSTNTAGLSDDNGRSKAQTVISEYYKHLTNQDFDWQTKEPPTPGRKI